MKILNVAVYLIIFQISVFQVIGSKRGRMEDVTNESVNDYETRIKSEQDTYKTILKLQDNDVNLEEKIMEQLKNFLNEEKVITGISNGNIQVEQNLNLQNNTFTMKARYLKVFSKIVFIILVVILYD
jgi:hypothetical protein